jgi:hypothetical protein
VTKQRDQQLTDIMARVLHYQDSGEPDWATMDYAAMQREYAELPRPIIDRYLNDAKFHAQVHRAVSMLLDLDKRTDEPSEVIHTVGIGYCDNCDCEHCSEIRSPVRAT